MEPLLNWQIWTDLSLPPLGAGSRAVYLAAGGLCGLLTAVLAHRAWRDHGQEPWRRLRFAGSMLALAFWPRALLHERVVVPVEVSAAVFTVIDLVLLAMFLGAVRSLLPKRGGGRSNLLLHVLAAGAIFGGLLAGDPHQPVLERNLPAAAAHLVVLWGLHVMLQWTLLGDLRRQREEVQCSNLALSDRLKAASSESQQLARKNEEALEKLSRDEEIVGVCVRRAGMLEQLLAGAVELQARRAQHDLHEFAVHLVHDLCRFEEVVLYQWSDSLGVFEVQAAAGLDAEQARGRTTTHLERAQYDLLANPHFRLSESFLIPPPSRGVEEPALPSGPNVAPGQIQWPPGQRLVAPLADPFGKVRGFLDLSRPKPGRPPGLQDIHHIELLARQIASVLEGMQMREHLAGMRAEMAQATERLQALGDLRHNLVANVSHELRTPLTSIIGYSEMLRDRGEEMTSEMRREFLSVIHEQGQRFKEVVNDLLELGRSGDVADRPEGIECDVAALVQRMVEDWHQRAKAAELQLTVESESPGAVLDADPVLCQQLLNHLLDNAFKFTPPGGRIRVHLGEQGTAVRLEVEDSGIGIPEEKLHTIFEQFYQVDASNTRKKGGQGVGLAICRDIVSWHDGRIWAENMSGGGTRLTVLLPRRSRVVLPDPPKSVPAVFQEPRLFLQRLVHWVGENLGVQTVVLLLADRGGDHLRVLCATGLPAGRFEGLHLAPSVGLAGRVWLDGRTRLESPEAGDVLLADQTPALCAALNRDQVLHGVVVVRDRLDGRPLSDDDRLLLEAMAPRLAHMLAQYESYQEQSREFAAIQSSLRMTTRVGILPYTDVAAVCQEVCLATARRLGLYGDEMRDLAFALQYHDVGLDSVPPYLLNKTGRLTEDERVLLERHVHVGLATLAPLKPPPKVRQIILHHHENYDGTGFPGGLVGEAIPLGSRLVALHDSLRALLQQRPWRPAVPWAEALAEIQALAGTRYCPRLTKVFLEEAALRRSLIEDLRQHAEDGEDLRRPAPPHPLQLSKA